MPSESEIIERIRSRQVPDARVLVGIGDDAAILKSEPGQSMIACCDLSVENVHFNRSWAPLDVIGRKALAVTVSDVSAMGGTPLFGMLSVALPKGMSQAEVDPLFEGVFKAAAEFGMTIVGGDTSSSPGPLFIDTSIIGECSEKRAITRGGCRVGDVIYVTGVLGGSHVGLSLLQKGRRLDDFQSMVPPGTDPEREAILRHLVPQPRIQAGKSLGESGIPSAMIDVSDGLSTDLSHLLEESSLGATIHASRLPIADYLLHLDSELKIDPLEAALNGGEEYELLFTAAANSRARIAALSTTLGLPITEIGQIVPEPGIRLVEDGTERLITPSGYEHQI